MNNILLGLLYGLLFLAIATAVKAAWWFGIKLWCRYRKDKS
jgi:hypothetical protein